MRGGARHFHGFDGRCSCYVGRLPDVVLFGARRGIHNPTCAVYRESVDPADQMEDDDFRRMAEITGTPEIVGALAERGATLRRGARI